MLPRPLVTALAVLISIAWAANLLVGFLYPGRSDPALNAIFAIVVGAVFALGRRDERSVARAVRKKIAEVVDPGSSDGDTPDRGDHS